MVFQAVAEYRTEVKKQDVNLNIELSVEGRSTHNRWTFTRSNTHVTRSDKVNQHIWVNRHAQFAFALQFLCISLISMSNVLTTGQTDTEIQRHCSWERDGHSLGERSWALATSVTCYFKRFTAWSVLRCIPCIMPCLKREKMTVMRLISVWRWRNSSTVGFISSPAFMSSSCISGV